MGAAKVHYFSSNLLYIKETEVVFLFLAILLNFYSGHSTLACQEKSSPSSSRFVSNIPLWASTNGYICHQDRLRWCNHVCLCVSACVLHNYVAECISDFWFYEYDMNLHIKWASLSLSLAPWNTCYIFKLTHWNLCLFKIWFLFSGHFFLQGILFLYIKTEKRLCGMRILELLFLSKLLILFSLIFLAFSVLSWKNSPLHSDIRLYYLSGR